MGTKQVIPPLIVIVGETASGKSTTALELAKMLDGEIICADSRTVYKSMDIGTAKPSVKVQAAVPHHLLDIVNPNEDFNVSIFQKKANESINKIWTKGKWPIMVGGTGLYVDSILFNYQFRKPKNLTQRRLLEKVPLDKLVDQARQKGLDILDEKNRRHLTRLIESGQDSPNNRQNMRDSTLIIGLSINRTQLRQRIIDRVETMFRTGLKKEVDDLLKTYSWDDPGMTAIGYKEFYEYYEGNLSMGKVKQKIVYNTLQYAKRQRTWFKRNRYIRWTDDPDDVKKIVQGFTAKYLKDKTV